jgi:carbonic anhydrase/acetyltransferase-like protein (isoleucine patch superfamily)
VVTVNTSVSLRYFANSYPQIGQRVMIDASAVLIGKVTVGDDSSVWPQAVIRGDVNNIIIGQRTNIQDGCVLHVNSANSSGNNPLIIGDDVTVGHNATLHGCVIGNRVLVGMGCIVLDGAVLEDNIILGVGSIVTSNKILKSGYLYLGTPAKAVRPLTEKEIEHLKTSAEGYVKIKNEYLTQSKTM